MSKLISQTARYKVFRGYVLQEIFLEIAEWLKEGPASIDAIDIHFDGEYTDWRARVFFDAHATFDHSLEGEDGEG